MSDQPRWPRGTPVAPSGRGPGGGRYRSDELAALQFRENPGGNADWVARAGARVTPRGHDRRLGLSRDDLRGLYRANLQSYRDDALSGGSVALTRRRTFDSGQRVIIKTSSVEEAEVEYLASLVGEAIEAPVPAVIMVGPGEVWMSHAEGSDRHFDTGLTQAIRVGSDLRVTDWEEQWADTEPAWRLGLLDFLIANNDRHGGNWMSDPADDTLEIDPDSVVGIDHNRAWYSIPRAQARPPQPGDPPPASLANGNHQAMAIALLDPDDYGRWRTGRLSPQEAEQIDLRLRSLRPEFARLGREDMYDYTIGAWEAYLHAVRAGDADDGLEDARVSTPEALADRIFQGERIEIRFDADAVRDWQGWGHIIPGWHPAVYATRTQAGEQFEIQLEPRALGTVIQWRVDSGTPLTYRVVRPR